MKHKISFALPLLLALTACRSNPHKAEKIETKMDNTATVSGSQAVGVKNGDMVVLDKAAMSEKLRDLQNGVFALEDRVYGTRKLGSLGLYGELKTCKRKQASRQYGGSGTMIWTEPLDRVTDKEDELKIGLDEKSNLVGVQEEFLKDRVQRFTGYKMILQKRADEFEAKIAECNGQLVSKELDGDQSAKVMVTEAAKAVVDKAGVNRYMCGFVKSGASLQALMLNAFAKGWLSLSDFNGGQNLLPASLKDGKGVAKENAMIFYGWKLAFDTSPISVTELLNDDKNAKLVAWAYDKKADVDGGAKCLSAADGVWN